MLYVLFPVNGVEKKKNKNHCFESKPQNKHPFLALNKQDVLSICVGGKYSA